MLVSFDAYRPVERFDGIPWTQIKIEESATGDVPWTLIDTIAISPVDPDPSQPAERSFSTDNAVVPNGWYRVSFLDAQNNRSYTDPVQYAPTEILASLDDINGQLDGDIVTANLVNTAKIQASVARVIRANLSQVLSTTILYSWQTPETTPDTIREVAAKLIAAQLYMAKVSTSGDIIPDDHYAMRLYTEGMDMLKRVISGEIIIPGVLETPSDSISDLDYFPVDATDRAFTMGMEL